MTVLKKQVAFTEWVDDNFLKKVAAITDAGKIIKVGTDGVLTFIDPDYIDRIEQQLTNEQFREALATKIDAKTFQDAMANISSFSYKVVTELPAPEDAEKGVLYLIEEGGEYAEYIAVVVGEETKMERLGVVSQVNLDDYYTKQQIDDAHDELSNRIDTKLGEAEASNLYASKDTVSDVVTSLQTMTELIAKKASQETVNTLQDNLNTVSDSVDALDTRVTKNETDIATINTALDTYATKTELNDGLDLKADKTDLADKVDTKTFTDTLANITSFSYEVVEALPSLEDAEKGVLYLVADDREAPDLYNEYLLIENGEDRSFECIGRHEEIDFSNLYTKTEVDDFLKDKADKEHGRHLDEKAWVINDFNTATSDGFYIARREPLALNSPIIPEDSSLPLYGLVWASEDGSVRQEVSCGDKTFIRELINETWSDWKDVSVSSLQTELDKKMDKDLGVDNAGKVLQVGEDGQVAFVDSTSLNVTLSDYATTAMLTKEIAARTNADKAMDTRIKTIEDDYLTSADKTELSDSITGVDTRLTEAEKKIDGFATKTYVDEQVDSVRYMIDDITSVRWRLGVVGGALYMIDDYTGSSTPVPISPDTIGAIQNKLTELQTQVEGHEDRIVNLEKNGTGSGTGKDYDKELKEANDKIVNLETRLADMETLMTKVLAGEDNVFVAKEDEE